MENLLVGTKKWVFLQCFSASECGLFKTAEDTNLFSKAIDFKNLFFKVIEEAEGGCGGI